MTAPADTLETNQAKQFVTGEIGTRLDEQLTAASNRQQQAAGASHAYHNGATKILLLLDHVKRDFENKESELHKSLEGAALVRAYVNKYITRCSEAMENLKVQSKAVEVQAGGAVIDLKQAVETVQRYHTSATKRIINIVEVATEAAKPNGKNGTSVRRPGDGSAKKELRARMDAEKAKQNKKPTKKKKAAKKRRR